jgi:hypothetical protein
MNMYWRSGGIAPRILNLGTSGGDWSASRPGRVKPRGMRPCYPLNKRLGGPQSWSGRGGDEQTPYHCPCQELNPGRPSISLVTILTELPRVNAVCRTPKDVPVEHVHLNEAKLFHSLFFPTIRILSFIRFKGEVNIYSLNKLSCRNGAVSSFLPRRKKLLNPPSRKCRSFLLNDRTDA